MLETLYGTRRSSHSLNSVTCGPSCRSPILSHVVQIARKWKVWSWFTQWTTGNVADRIGNKPAMEGSSPQLKFCPVYRTCSFVESQTVIQSCKELNRWRCELQMSWRWMHCRTSFVAYTVHEITHLVGTWQKASKSPERIDRKLKSILGLCGKLECNSGSPNSQLVYMPIWFIAVPQDDTTSSSPFWIAKLL